MSVSVSVSVSVSMSASASASARVCVCVCLPARMALSSLCASHPRPLREVAATFENECKRSDLPRYPAWNVIHCLAAHWVPQSHGLHARLVQLQDIPAALIYRLVALANYVVQVLASILRRHITRPYYRVRKQGKKRIPTNWEAPF